MSTKNRKRLSILALVMMALMLATLVAPVLAGENRAGQHVIVGVDEVIPDDLYCSGETITIDGVVKGDVIALSSEIRINGTVEGDLIAVARTILINGTVKDDARIAGYDVQISEKGVVGDDLQIAAFSLNARAGSQIGGDLYVMGYQTQMDGRLAGKLMGAVNALIIGGEVGGDVIAHVGEPDPQFSQLEPFTRLSPLPILPPGLRLTDTAQIRGKLTYTSAGEGLIAKSARHGEIVRLTPPPEEVHKKPEPARKPSLGWAVLKWCLVQGRRLISLLVIGLLLAWLLPAVVPGAAQKLEQKAWPSLGWGCLVEIVFFVALPIVFFLVIGIGLLLGLLTLGGLQTTFISTGLLLEGLAAVAFAVITSYVTKIVVGYVFGRWLLSQAKSPQAAVPVWPAVLGIVLFVIVRAIPILGWLAGLAATLFGLGALWLWARDQQWWPWRSKPSPGGLPSVSPPLAALETPFVPAQEPVPTPDLIPPEDEPASVPPVPDEDITPRVELAEPEVAAEAEPKVEEPDEETVPQTSDGDNVTGDAL